MTKLDEIYVMPTDEQFENGLYKIKAFAIGYDDQGNIKSKKLGNFTDVMCISVNQKTKYTYSLSVNFQSAKMGTMSSYSIKQFKFTIHESGNSKLLIIKQKNFRAKAIKRNRKKEK